MTVIDLPLGIQRARSERTVTLYVLKGGGGQAKDDMHDDGRKKEEEKRQKLFGCLVLLKPIYSCGECRTTLSFTS